MTSSEWAAWVQAVGSVAAILVSVWIARAGDKRAASAERAAVEREWLAGEAAIKRELRAHELAVAREQATKDEDQNALIEVAMLLGTDVLIELNQHLADFEAHVRNGEKTHYMWGMNSQSGIRFLQQLNGFQERSRDPKLVTALGELADLCQKFKPLNGAAPASDFVGPIGTRAAEVEMALGKLKALKRSTDVASARI